MGAQLGTHLAPAGPFQELPGLSRAGRGEEKEKWRAVCSGASKTPLLCVCTEMSMVTARGRPGKWHLVKTPVPTCTQLFPHRHTFLPCSACRAPALSTCTSLGPGVCSNRKGAVPGVLTSSQACELLLHVVGVPVFLWASQQVQLLLGRGTVDFSQAEFPQARANKSLKNNK